MCVERGLVLKTSNSTMRRRDLAIHLTHSCYLRPYQCEFCGLKDTYEAITGNNFEVHFIRLNDDDYFGHQAMCPEAPLTCTNKCGMKKIKHKDMESHCRRCPQEPVECPFAEAGCKVKVRRRQLENHMTTSLQQHVMFLMIDYKQTKTELNEVKTKLSKVEATRNGFWNCVLKVTSSLTGYQGHGAWGRS